jgi:hypothetical protein
MSSFYSPQQYNQFSFGTPGQGGQARPLPTRPYQVPPMNSSFGGSPSLQQPSMGMQGTQGAGTQYYGLPGQVPAAPPPPAQQSEPEPPAPPPPPPPSPPGTNVNQGPIPGQMGMNLQNIDLSFLGGPGAVITPEMQRQMYSQGGASAAGLQFLSNLRTNSGGRGAVGRRMLQQFAEMDRRNKFLARRRALAPRAPRLPGEQIMVY